MITSQKEAINRLKNGFKLEVAERFNSYFYYLTNYKDTEITVNRNVIQKLKDKGIIDFNNDFKVV